LLVSKRRRQEEEKEVLFGERSATCLGSGSNFRRLLNATHKDKYRGDCRLRDNEDEDEDLPLIQKQRRQGREKSAKRVSSHEISQHELANLGINVDRNEGDVKNAYSHNKNHENHDDDDDNDGNNASQSHTPRRCKPIQPVKKRQLHLPANPFTPDPPPRSLSPSPDPAEDIDNDNDDEDDEDDEYITSPPQHKKKKSTKNPTPRKSIKSTKIPESKPKPKPKTPPKKSNPSTANKRSTAARNRNYTFPVASALSEATEADKMMFRFKGEGKTWKEIGDEWFRMTGRRPGTSSLSVRFIKLKEKFARMGDEDVSFLVLFFSLSLVRAVCGLLAGEC
jgi:hypothetical protein